MVDVIAWPPVGVIGTEWTEDSPVQISRSGITGRERVSAFQRPRRLARLIVPGIGKDTMGGGYMEMLKRHLKGRVNCVRLHSYAVNWHFDSRINDPLRSLLPLNWTTGDDPLDWTAGGDPLYWFTGSVITGTSTTVGGFPALSVSGLPPNMLVARPGEFVTVYPLIADADESYTSQITAPAYSDANGDAVLVLFDELPTGTGYGEWARVSIGVSESAVFRPVALPRAVQPQMGQWTYEWEFRQVFEEEVGTFTEVNPWTPANP